MKVATALIVLIGAANFVHAQTPAPGAAAPPDAAKPKVRHIIGLDTVSRNASGKLTVHDGVLEFKTTAGGNNVPVPSIDDVFVGTEVTQSGGKTGRVVKTAAIAAPYDSKAALTILMRTKVDILTVSFHDPDGGAHGAIFALPLGQAQQMLAQLIAAGAHTSPAEK